MKKSDTLILKGVAMMMMLVVHIWAQQLDNWVIIDGVRLWNYFANISEPVAFFLLLGGYGLACVREKGDTHHYSRLYRLYIHFWVVLIIFSIPAYLMKVPPIYPITAEGIILNFTSFHVYWNPICQFLLPYTLLSLSYPILFKLIDKFGIIIIGLFSFIIYGVSGMLYSKYGDLLVWEIPERFFFYLCPFMWGACLKISGFFQKSTIKGWKLIIFFFLLLIIKAFAKTPLITPIYVTLFVIVFVKMPRLKLLDKIFGSIGTQSMNMWFIHGWFCFILFKDELYSLQYPVVVFLVLLTISYFTSLLVDKIAKATYSIILKI